MNKRLPEKFQVAFSNGRFRQHQKFNGFAGFGNSAYACWKILCISMKLKTA
ncbi:hypothetical protein EIKCOROL_01206 [Eikenella corrodens ATCC 23834]|uniref:Uncharacterized protein n=1 Tax=Eikenella corrodens ATCC 23834 TaxID=546274 RepID=C0DV17_EIKCO|nr:hypothetical protein EIKCOROL_01206 [Eikenella corrodens ATCC 23834]